MLDHVPHATPGPQLRGPCSRTISPAPLKAHQTPGEAVLGAGKGLSWCSGALLPRTGATSHRPYLKFKVKLIRIKYNLQFHSPGTEPPKPRGHHTGWYSYEAFYGAASRHGFFLCILHRGQKEPMLRIKVKIKV